MEPTNRKQTAVIFKTCSKIFLPEKEPLSWVNCNRYSYRPPLSVPLSLPLASLTCGWRRSMLCAGLLVLDDQCDVAVD